MPRSRSSSFAWGQSATEYFYGLTPETILDAVESAGFRCTGRCLALNSMENRVFDVEIEDSSQPSGARGLIAKFYRPGRWNKDQILDEHFFLRDLAEQEIPVIAPLSSHDATLHTVPGHPILFTLFPKARGRNPDELNEDQLTRIGRQLGRMHNTGAFRNAPHRLTMEPTTFGMASLSHLKKDKHIPESMLGRYEQAVADICRLSTPDFEGFPTHRIHGDCHLGNLLWSEADGPFWVDFDDMVNGPAVQDIWLLTPGRDEESSWRREMLLRGYEEFREFDRAQFRLVEPLRALRYIHFSAWISKRWNDPAFPRAFPWYGTPGYWAEQLADLEECLECMRDNGNF